ncbi:MAG: beta-N-acetylglucosaminidase domain-containing protein [Bacteroidaceae bacterium]|nr:beta-N-acetylglucosaminidase domain-containing protein [Bacteroidaceae bacterium]
MKTKRVHFFLLALLCCMGAWAQDNPYGIYPVPHQTQTIRQTVALTQTVNIICGDGIDQYTRDRAVQVLEEHGKAVAFGSEPQNENGNHVAVLRLSIWNSPENVQLSLINAPFPEGKYDRHYISIRKQQADNLAEISIMGENTDATFYGLASLEQILDGDADSIVCGEIQDYADVKNRGIIEGYYGVPYSAEVTKDLFRFMARYKLNMYMYGAKSDPYHSQKWADAYPASITTQQRQLGYLSQSMLHDITKVAHQCKVNFIWAIHPGSTFTKSSDNTVVSKIMTKFQNMYRLGVRQFGLCVDDVGIPTDDATQKLNADRVTELQNLIDQKWNVEGAAPEDTVKPLNVVPQLYNFNQSTAENRQKFYNALSSTPAKVDIYITGQRTWTVPNSSDLQLGKSYLGREVSWWWNYVCNDQDVTKLFPLDTYTNFSIHPRISSSSRLETDLQGAKTILINPMQQGEVSKIALFSIGDYIWNTAAFDNMASWEAALPAVVGQGHAAALRRLAPYLSYFDSSAFNTLSTRFKSALDKGNGPTEAMQTEIQDILDACQNLHTMEASDLESDRFFYKDVRPWLLKLETMAQEVAKLMALVVSPNDDAKWEAFVKELNYVSTLNTDSRFAFDILTGMGSSIRLSTRYAEPAQESMMPFVRWLSENALGKDFFTDLNAKNPGFAGSREDMNGTATFYSSSGSAFVTLPKPIVMSRGDYAGISLPFATRIEEIAVADTLWEHYDMLCSANGKQWLEMQKGAPLPLDHIKYVVFQNPHETPRVLNLSKTVFSLTLPTKLKPMSATTPQCSAGFYDGHTEKYLFDNDYSTWTCIRRNQENDDAYTVRLRKATPVYDVRICMGTENGDYMTAGLVQLSEDGKTWESIPICGTTDTNYTLENEHNVKYNDEMTYCDFDGQGKTARFVRLFLSTPKTSNWLRIYEIEVNGRQYEEAYQGLAVDASGMTIPELTDTKGSTCLKEMANGNLFWHLRSQQYAKALIVYRDGGTKTDATVSVTTDGEQWEELGKLEGYISRFDLTSYPLAVAVKISWRSKAPLIYEISEETDTATVIVTGIGQLDKQTADAKWSNSKWYDLSGRKLPMVNGQCSMPKGIYIRNGKKVCIK